MAGGGFFSNFPLINYNNNLAVDITERIVVQQTPLQNPYDYYPLDVKNDDRAENIAFTTWGNPYNDWIIYLTNNIIDPYYDYYLSEQQFQDFIDIKYGSVEYAQQKIVNWSNNWANQSDIDVNTFSIYTPNQQNYWVPKYNNNGNIIGYTRKPIDWSFSTNSIINLTIENNVGNFVADEVVNIQYDNSGLYTGTAQLITANATNVILQHIIDYAYPYSPATITSNSIINGVLSSATATITNAVFLANNIPVDLVSYYAPVYCYDMEQIKNENNKTLLILQSNLVNDFVNTTNVLLNNTNIQL